jgi:hypothetical protein
MKFIDVTSQVTKPHFVLVYGGSGTGKTHLAGTVAEDGLTLVIDVDQGMETLSCAPKLAKARNNLIVSTFDTFGDLNTIYKLVQKNDPAAWSAQLKLTGDDALTEPFKWVVWDTWSELQFYMMEQLRKEKDHGQFANKLEFRRNVEIQHWGLMTDLNKLAIQELRKCTVNQIFVMQETIIKDELSGVVTGGPAIHGKLVQEIPAYFGTVIHTGANLSGQFTATTKAVGRWPAKTRRGVGQLYTDSTMKQILEL